MKPPPTSQITGPRNELGRLLAQQALPAGVHFDVAGQQANTLLHDGHAWKGFARSLRDGARHAMQADADRLVFASFAWVLGKPQKDPLRSLAEVVLETEAAILAGPIPACVLRLGYLYGPHSADLLAYRKAFALHRPYWSGPRSAGQFHLHQDDAVSALLAAASPRLAGRTLYATSGERVSFMQFMDHFARRLGTRWPLHAPRLAAPLFKLVVREEHMQQAALSMPAQAPSPRLPGWRPHWPDHRSAQAAIVAGWDKAADKAD